MKYICDNERHLICVPYSVDGLHQMADDLKIDRCWFHRAKYKHYDIPKSRVEEIQAKCEIVSPREIVRIIKASVV